MLFRSIRSRGSRRACTCPGSLDGPALRRTRPDRCRSFFSSHAPWRSMHHQYVDKVRRVSNRRQAKHTARTAHRRTLPRINVRSRASTYAPAHRGVPSTMATDDGEVVTPRLRARPGAGARVPRGTTSGTWLPRAAALREEVPTAHPLPPSTRHSGGKQVGAGDYVDPLRAARPSRAASTRERGAYGRAVLGVAALLIAMEIGRAHV